MADVELRVTADLDQATKELSGFSKEYAALVKQVEKPLRQVNATRELEASLESTGQKVRTARQNLQELQRELINTDHPTERLKESFKSTAKELQKLERVEATQANQLSRMRAELKGAGVDTTRLAAEQRRLNGELTGALGTGRQDAAARGIREHAAALKQQALAQRQANMEAARDNLGVNRHRLLQAEIQRATQQYELLRRSGKLTATELGVAQQQLTQRIRESKTAMKELAGQQAGGGVLSAVGSRLGVGGGAAFGVAGGVAIAAQYAAAVDPIKKMNAQLQLATDSQEEFARAQAATFRIAQDNQAPLEDVVTLYSRLTPALRDVGRGQGDALKIIDAVTKSLRISGATAQETASTIQQFSQALGSGVLRGEEFNTLAESSPRLLRALADGLNVNVGALRAMAAEGKLTADVISDALIGQLSKLTKEAAELPGTFGGAMIKLTNSLQVALGKFDELTGASGRVVDKINAFTAAINLLATGSLEKASAGVALLSLEMARLLPHIDLAATGIEKLMATAGLGTLSDQLKKTANDEVKVYDFRAERLATHAAKVRGIHKQAATDTKSILDQQVTDTKAALAEQVKAERKAASELEAAKSAQLETQKRYKEALASLNAGPRGEATYGQAESLKVAARGALQSGDVEGAKRQAQAALAVLQQMAEAGKNTYGFAGFIKELQAIEESADQRGVDEAQAKLEKAKAAAVETKQALEALKDIEVAPTLDAEAQQKLLDDLAKLAQQAGVIMTIPVTPVASAGSVDASPLPAAATGGIFRGPGTGTSDSILARVSTGEGIVNARAVQHYGPEVVHMLNRLRLPKFASGGVVGERSLPTIPAMSPSLLRSAASQPESLGTVNISLDGQSYQMQANQQTFTDLVQRQKWKRGSTR